MTIEINLLTVLIGLLIGTFTGFIIQGAFVYIRQRNIIKAKEDRIKALTKQLKAKRSSSDSLPKGLMNMAADALKDVKLPPQAKSDDNWAAFEEPVEVDGEQ